MREIAVSQLRQIGKATWSSIGRAAGAIASTCWNEFEPRHWHYSDASPNNVKPKSRMLFGAVLSLWLLNELPFVEFVQDKTTPRT